MASARCCKQIAGGGFITNSAASTQTFVVGGTSATDVATNLNSTIGAMADNVLRQCA